MLELENIRNHSKTRESKISEIDEKMFSKVEIKSFFGHEGFEIQSVKRFEETCFLMSQMSSKDAKSMTVTEYLQANETLNKKK